MIKKNLIPPSFSLIKMGKTYLLLHEEYKEILLQKRIEDIENFLKKNLRRTHYLTGRIPHPSMLMEGGKRIVFRQYWHGGLFSKITRNLYLFGSRSFQELRLTEEIRSCGIPTIQLVGAIHQRVFGPFYRAFLLSLEIPDAKDLIQYFKEFRNKPSTENLLLKRKIIRSLGLMIRDFHQAGFFHEDLQLRNILVAGDKLLIIDFDRSYRRERLSIRKRLKNLLRLNRSVEKWKRLDLPITWTDRMRFFKAYAGEDKRIWKEIRKALLIFRIRSFFSRFGWKLEELINRF